MRKLADGTWVDAGSGRPIGVEDADWVRNVWAKWDTPMPPSVRKAIGEPDEGGQGSGDRVPWVPTPPVPAAALALDLPRD